MKKDLHVAIAGATGAVGIEMLKTLEKRNFPVGKLTPLASKRSAGKSLSFRGEEVTVQELTKDSFAGVDIALFSCLLYTSPSPRDKRQSRMPSSA